MTLIIHFHTAKVHPFPALSKHFPNFSPAIWRHLRQPATPSSSPLQICRLPAKLVPSSHRDCTGLLVVCFAFYLPALMMTFCPL